MENALDDWAKALGEEVKSVGYYIRIENYKYRANQIFYSIFYT